ncbi:MAG: FG-GAP-like repeat-containing protein, partial [Rudaea sp.]
MSLPVGVIPARRFTRGWSGTAAFILCVAAGISPPFPAQASVQLQGFGVTPSGPGTINPQTTTTTGTPASVPATWDEPLPSADVYSDSVGATPATYRTDESGAATYSVPIYVPPGTAGLVPALSLEYNNRALNGPLGPGFTLGGLSAISRCKKATEYGDGPGPFPAINFDGVAADQAYCLDGARLLDLNSGAGNCPAGQSGDIAHVFGLELDPATRVCGYAKTGITGYAYWLVQPKDGSDRAYGVGNNSALVRNDGNGNADTTQYFSWGLSRIADTTGNTVELSYNQNSATGELDIAQIRYTGKIAMTDVLNPAPTFTRSPYANITFNYGTLPAASQRVDYVAGMKLALTQQLTTITVNGPSNANGDISTSKVARTYHLNYGTPTSSGLSALTSLQECVPNGSGEVCYPPTQFSWDYIRGSTPGYPNAPSTQSYSSSGLQYAIDYKSGDVDGDGREDLVWVKDQSCDNTGSGATRFQVFVSLAKSTGLAAPIATGVYLSRPSAPSCGNDMRSLHFDTLYFLYDFSGDGRADLLAANGSTWNGTYWTDMAWKIFPTIAVTGGYAFDGAHPVATGITASPSDDGMLADENGDGLPDLVHPTPQGGITSHLLQRQASGTLTFNFSATETGLVINTPTGTSFEIGFAPGPGRNLLNADLNGDGASDFVFKVIQDTNCGNTPTTAGATTAQGATYHFAPSSIPDLLACRENWYTFLNQGVQSDGLHLTYETKIGTVGSIPADGSYISLVDLNGDGQADLVYPHLDNNGNYVYYYRLNQGKTSDSATTERFGAETAVGLTLSPSWAERLQLIDVNGDHRTDILYEDGVADGSGSYPLKALYWGATSPTGFGSPVDVGNSTLNAQNPMSVQSFLLDVDGNGGPDIVRFDGSTLSVYGYGPTFGGNDFITTIVNGLGALTGISYYPLAYASGYTRAYDGPALNLGRGSPVFDVFSAIWVVHSAVSSAPTAGNPTAESSVVYRYSGAKIQAGGRGFLGFATVQAENQQPAQDTGKYLVTTTHYLQGFPYIGRPDETVVELEASLQPDPCNSSPGDPCFVHEPPPCGSGGTRCNAPVQIAALGVGGQLLSEANDSYTSTPAFSPGTVQPLLPYMSDSDEQKFDVTTPGAFSHDVHSTFTEDIYGNVTGSTVASAESGGTDETKSTSNIYGCTIAPPTKNCSTLNAEWQRLGRLSVSTVTSMRPGQTNNVRRASFEYDPTTLLRIADIQGPYDSTDEPNVNVLKTLGLRTDLIRDADGNVTEQVQCSTYHFANRAACTNLSNFQQRQWPSDTTKIQRYAKWNYESLGRFELYKLAPFYSSSATSNTDEDIAEYVGIAISGSSPLPAHFVPQAPLPVVVNRDVFGNPANK